MTCCSPAARRARYGRRVTLGSVGVAWLNTRPFAAVLNPRMSSRVRGIAVVSSANSAVMQSNHCAEVAKSRRGGGEIASRLPGNLSLASPCR